MTTPRKLARGVCDVLLILIALRLALLTIILPFYLVPEERCRLSWNDIAEYDALAAVCKDRYVAARLMMWDMADSVARESSRGKAAP